MACGTGALAILSADGRTRSRTPVWGLGFRAESSSGSGIIGKRRDPVRNACCLCPLFGVGGSLPAYQ